MNEYLLMLIITVFAAGTGIIFVMGTIAKMILAAIVISCLLAILFLFCVFGAAKLVAVLLDKSNERDRTMHSRSTGYPIE